MAFLGIDYGDKRIGLAVSDELGIAAHGLETLVRTTLESDLQVIAAIVRERHVEAVAMGLPRNMDGSLGPQAKRVEEFAEKLKPAVGVPIHFVDERLTTERAHRAITEAGHTRKGRRERVDRIAAQFILTQFMAVRRVRPVDEETEI